MRVLLALLLVVGISGCAKEIEPPPVRPVSMDPALSRFCRESVGQIAFGIYYENQKTGWATDVNGGPKVRRGSRRSKSAAPC